MRSWQTIGAVLLIGTVRHILPIKKFFETGFAQFLGTISFSLYLLHQTVYRILLDRLLNAVGWVFMGEGFWAASKADNPREGVFAIGWIVSTVIIGTVCAVLSRIMARTVDERSVRLAHHVEAILS